MSSTVGALDQRLRTDDEQTRSQLIVAIAHTALTLLLALATILLLRRISGGFHQSLSAAGIILAAAFVEIYVCGLRQLYRNPNFQHSRLSTQYLVPGTAPIQRLFSIPIQLRFSPVDAITTTAVVAVAIALSVGGTPAFGLFVAWLIVAGGEIGQRLPAFRAVRANVVPQQSSPTQMPASCVSTEEVAEPEIPQGLVQQVTRVVEDGRESIHGLVKAEVAANDRVAVVHIAFCPPLGERPELSAHALDCDDAEIRLTQVESFGARLEARLPAVSDVPRGLIIEILGSAKASPCS